MRKKLFKSILSVVSCMVMFIGIFAMTSISTANDYAGAAAAESFVTHFTKNGKVQKESNMVVIDNAVNDGDGKATYLLYYADGNGDIADFFSQYLSTTKAVNTGNYTSNSEEFIHKVHNSSISILADASHNGDVYSTLKLSPNMVLAANSGHVSLKATALLTSKSGIENTWGSKDQDLAETIYMMLHAYNNANQVGYHSETVTVAGQTSYPDESNPYTVEIGNFSGKDCDIIELQFMSEFNNGGGITVNYMAIKRPTIIVSTDDMSAPNLSFDYESGYASSRNIAISVDDYASGIQKVEYKMGEGNDWTSVGDFSSYEIEYNFNVEMTDNVNLYVKTTDNVGNEKIYTYEESEIDKDAPTISVTFDRAETDMITTFNAEISSNLTENSVQSKESFYYTYKINGVEVPGEYEVVNGTNNFTATKVGVYEFTFYAKDEVYTNSITINQTFKKLLVVNNVTKNYTYSADGTIFEFGNLTHHNGDKFEELTQDEIDAVALGVSFKKDGAAVKTLTNVGEYTYEFACSKFYVIENASGTITISPYNLTITYGELSVEYLADYLPIDFTLDIESARSGLTITYFKGKTQVGVPVEVGEYSVSIEYTKDGNYYLNEENIAYTVTKRTINVVAIGKEITYGDEIGTLSFTVENGISSHHLENLFVLLCEGEGILDVVQGGYNLYFRQQKSLTSEESEILKNYIVNYVYGEAKLIVNKQMVYVYADAYSKEYGTKNDPEFTYIIKNVNGDDITKLVPVNGKLTRTAGENVGIYDLSAENLYSQNYEFSLIPSVFQITKRMAFVFIKNATKVYLDADPSFGFIDGTMTFAKSNILEDDIEYFVKALKRTAGDNVGYYSIYVDGSCEVVSNYIIVAAEGIFEITKRAVTVKAKDITAEYGTTSDLEYIVYDGSMMLDKNILKGIVLDGKLIRVAGEELGEYAISQGTLSSNNFDITFIGGTYNIVKRNITIKVVGGNKKYGEVDKVEVEISGVGFSEIVVVENNFLSLNFSGIMCDITLIRELGEDVISTGYAYLKALISDTDHYDIQFISGSLMIEKKQITVSIQDASKNYGEKDPEFNYVVDGAVDGDEIKLIVVANGNGDAGEYVLSLQSALLKNYEVVSVTNGKFVIKKADLNWTLEDKSVPYSGNAEGIFIDTDLEVTYSYKNKSTSSTVSACINAGEYVVTATVAESKNYNKLTLTANLTITPKLIQVVVKQAKFNYSGMVCSPEIEYNITENVPKTIEFYDTNGNLVLNPKEVGEYTFKIISLSDNYVCDYVGTMIIYSVFYTESENGSASAVSNGVGTSSYDIHIYENKNSGLGSVFSAFKNDRKTMAVYSFTNPDVKTNNEVFKVKIAARSGKNVEIYTVDKNGKYTKISYTLEDGYYVFSVNDISLSIIVTAADYTMLYAKIIASLLTILLFIIVTKSVKRSKLNNFFKNNTYVFSSNAEELAANNEIVEERSVEATTSATDFLSE